MSFRLGILASHPIQYQAPLFRELARHADLKVYFAHRETAVGQGAAGFNVEFEWDVDLLGGYDHTFLQNLSRHPGVNNFFGCDTPEIADVIRKDGFDAFLVTGWYLKFYWQAIRACHRHGVPVMVRGDSQLNTPRSMLKQLAKEIVYPRVLRQFDACLYVGQKNKEYLQHYGVPQERLFFSPHCIDIEAFKSRVQTVTNEEIRAEFGILAGRKAVLFVGKFLERKRPLDIIHALQVLRARGVDAWGVFAGDGPLRAELEKKAGDLDVPVIFLGFRNQSELPATYAMSDLLILPSEGSETWGLVVNESLACGTPVVVSDAVGCAPNLVISGSTGEIYPMGNVEALADAIHSVLISPPSKHSIKRVSSDYSIERAADGILSAIEYVAP